VQADECLCNIAARKHIHVSKTINVLFITSSGYDAVGHGRHFIHEKIDRL